MKTKFKLRFKSIVKMSRFIWTHLRIADNRSMSCMMNKSKSGDGKQTYYTLIGWYEPEPKKGEQ
ncbi:hypothetical protein KAR91_12290 [Candidatus Pacearchaeota archaeon]|nr:hypothetical protein [Candidatus Pacearchaeota archaeon]